MRREAAATVCRTWPLVAYVILSVCCRSVAHLLRLLGQQRNCRSQLRRLLHPLTTLHSFEHPYDLIKVRLQSQPLHRPLIYKGPWHCFRDTVAKEGYRGLYRGLSSPLIGATVENAVVFLVYNQFNQFVRSWQQIGPHQEVSIPITALGAAFAGAAASFVLTPIEYVKCVMQVQQMARSQSGSTSLSSQKLPGPLAIVASAVKSKGLRGLWLGQTATLLRESGGNVGWFCTYELVARYFVNRRASSTATKSDLTDLELIAAGASAGVCYNFGFFPADSIKSAIQTAEELSPHQPKKTFSEMGKSILRTRGIRGLYVGQ